MSKGKEESKDESKDDAKDKDDKDKDDSKDDEAATKEYTETYQVQYTGDDDESQEVKVYIRDKDDQGSSAAQTYNIKENKTIKIPMTIEKGKTAGFTVRVDDKVVADKDIPYDF